MHWNAKEFSSFFYCCVRSPKEYWIPILNSAEEIFFRIDNETWINADIESIQPIPSELMDRAA